MKFIVSCIVSLVLFSGIAVHADKPRSSDDVVILWNNAAMNAAQDNISGALVMVRALAIMHTAIFDAWAQYDPAAEPTLRTLSRRPAPERTIENKQEAISYAAYRALVDLFPSDIAKFDQLMNVLGYEPRSAQYHFSAPAVIGLYAASAVLEHRHHDGANQLGDLHPGAYSDYTGYASVNRQDEISDPDRWQPLHGDRNGNPSTQMFYMPQWGFVKPFGFDSVVDLRPQTGPKSYRSDPGGYIAQAREIVEFSNHLTHGYMLGDAVAGALPSGTASDARGSGFRDVRAVKK